jgi:hypothetical protein
MTVRILSSQPLRLLILGIGGFWGCSTDHDPAGNAGGAAGVETGGAGAAGRGNENGAAGGKAGGGAASGSAGKDSGMGSAGAGTASTGDGGNGAASGGDGGNASVNTGDGGSGATNGGEGGNGGASHANADNGGGGGAEVGCGEAGMVPSVLLMIDNSSSMFDPRESLWDPLYSVLMKPTDGIVATFQSQVRFGFTSYRGTAIASDPQCPVLFEVDYELDNFDAINARYSAQNAEYTVGVKWETPTGAAIAKVAQKLAANTSDPSGPKYIVLVTDGNPNTCATLDPECGSDEAIKAVQDAKALGITTFVIGIGDLTGPATGCEAAWGRCGADFMQDMANAGKGLPVHAPPESLKYLPCTPTNTLAASYAAASDAPGTATYYAAKDAGDLDAAFRAVLSSVLTCQ